MTTEYLKHYATEYKQIARSLPGQPIEWLKSLREQAFECFLEQGFPTLGEEEWRYTNLSAIEKKIFSPQLSVIEDKVTPTWLDNYRLKEAITVVLVNGQFSQELSNLAGLTADISVLSMAEALVLKTALVKQHLGKAVSNQEHGFTVFNTAWFSDGLFVHMPAKRVLKKPIQLLHLVTQADCLISNRHLFLIDEGAEVEIIETFVGINDAYLTNTVTEIFVGENANLSLYKIQNEGDKAYHFGGTYVKQANASSFKHHNFALGSLLARNDIHTDLKRSSECDLNGLYLATKRQHIDNHTRINHLQAHATSRELYKGVLNQRARGVFQGRVFVAKDAQKTNSEMRNHNYLLSKDAEADAKPQLEIYADDVKCTHGVTAGELDEKSIFYLQSRCVDEATARNMLTFAFANEMIEKVKLNALHEILLTQLLIRFPQANINKEWL